jgi:glycerol uptake facilitator-like aquaporin
MFSATFAGIAPSSVPPYIAAQILGGALAVLVIRALYPRLAPADAAEIIVPHHHQDPAQQAGPAASDGAAAPHPPR